MIEVDQIVHRVQALEERNRRVDADKAWETSKTRRLLLAVLTYVVIASYLQVVVHLSPWLNAVVPTAAFLISTLALQVAKRAWMRHVIDHRRTD